MNKFYEDTRKAYLDSIAECSRLVNYARSVNDLDLGLKAMNQMLDIHDKLDKLNESCNWGVTL